MYRTLYERGSEQSQKHSHTNGDLTHKSITSELGGKGGPLNSNLSHSHWALGRHSFDSLTFLRARDRWLDQVYPENAEFSSGSVLRKFTALQVPLRKTIENGMQE